MAFKNHIQAIQQEQAIKLNDRDLEIIKANSLDLWKKELEDDIREQRSQHDVQQTRKRKSITYELTKEDFDDINNLIKTVDKILNLDNIDTNKDNENINKFKKDIKQKYRLSNIDIFKFRLANANCMRCIALFPGIEENLSYITNGEYRITHQQHGVAYNAVFTINDLYYSRKKICNFSDANWITLDLFQLWFTKPWKKLPQWNLRTLVEKSYRVSVQPNIVNYLKADADNLMINIFILFLAFSDGIATLSMYTDPGAEPEYYYKSDSVDMQEVLILFKTHKSTILNMLASELSKAQGQGINLIDILTKMANEQSGVQSPIYIIISSMLDAYSNVYYGKQTTNLSDDLNNEFFQHYQVKFTLFTTMVVTFVKDKLKGCTFNCDKPSVDKQKDICNKQGDINKKRQDTRKLNKQRALDAAKAQEADLKSMRVVQLINRRDRAARRDASKIPRSGGSTKIVLYLVKIEKLRELNKKLRKNKTKNKSKIEKNNKLIDELKVKIKKQKEKEKLKKQKEKKLEKQKLKKEKDKLKKQKKQKK